MGITDKMDMKAIGICAPASKFTIDDIPDQTGRVVIVTGANTGLGRYTAEQLLVKGAKVYAACRSQERAEVAIADIKTRTGKNDIHFLHLDLGDMKQAHQAGLDFGKIESKLDLLVNSAGVMFPPKGSTTKDGYELQFGTNVLGHYAFTTALLPLMKVAAKASLPGAVRVVWVSSAGHFLMIGKEGIDYESITNVSKVSNQTHYGQSKLGDIHLSNDMAEKLRDDGIISVSLHPGTVKTELARHANSMTQLISNMVFSEISQGAITQIYAATSPELTMEDTGAYYVPWCRKYHPSHPKAQDPVAQEQTVDYCKAQLIKVVGAENVET